jgi:hypothetical protein
MPDIVQGAINFLRAAQKKRGFSRKLTAGIVAATASPFHQID